MKNWGYEESAVKQQLHLAALVTSESKRACVIDFEDDQGDHTVMTTVRYFTNTTVCLNSGQLVHIQDIRKVTC